MLGSPCILASPAFRTCRTHGRGPLPLELLSELLCQHTAKEVHATLAALLEYLLLPGTVSDWLPAPSAIPLKYAGVLDLHMYPLASQVADAIVASLPFSSNIRTDGFPPAQWDLAKMPATTLPRAAYFAICSEELYRDGRLTGEFGTAVYRVGIPHYQPWPPQRSNYPVWTTAPLEQIFGAASRSGRSVRLHDLADRCIGGRTALGGCVAVELQAAVSSIAVQGRTGAVRVECQVGAHTNDSLYALWAVAW